VAILRSLGIKMAVELVDEAGSSVIDWQRVVVEEVKAVVVDNVRGCVDEGGRATLQEVFNRGDSKTAAL